MGRSKSQLDLEMSCILLESKLKFKAQILHFEPPYLLMAVFGGVLD